MADPVWGVELGIQYGMGGCLAHATHPALGRFHVWGVEDKFLGEKNET